MQVLMSSIRTPNVHPAERWLSVAGGAALLVHGLRKGGLIKMLAGAMMMSRGVTGRCQVYRALGIRTAGGGKPLSYEQGVLARASITLKQPREQVYAFWRQFENLPHFMKHLTSVETTDGKNSHWVAEGLGGKRYEWNAEIINEIPNELIAWRSLPGSDVESAGSVRFSDAPGGQGTEVRVALQYNPPLGIVGAYVARLFDREPEQEIGSDLLRLKQYLEAGEVATIEGQPAGSPQGQRAEPSRQREEAFA